MGFLNLLASLIRESNKPTSLRDDDKASKAMDYNSKGKWYAERGHYHQALLFFRDAEKLLPNNYEIQHNIEACRRLIHEEKYSSNNEVNRYENKYCSSERNYYSKPKNEVNRYENKYCSSERNYNSNQSDEYGYNVHNRYEEAKRLNQRGKELANDYRYSEAYDCFLRASKLDPNNKAIRHNLNLCLSYLKY